MSGTDASADALNSLEALLRRDSPLNALEGLAAALGPPPSYDSALTGSAVCLDSNIFLKLASHPRRAEIVDYFLVKHDAPLVISAQSVQEFWNSQLAAIETVAVSIQRKFSDLEKEVEKVEEDFGDYPARFAALLSEFQVNYGHLHDKNARRNVSALVEMLAKRARVSEVPRHRFYCYAEPRQRTKTPPGFKDSGDGDFYVWLDFLYGMALDKRCGKRFRRAVLITDDRKVDWCRGGVPHPTLAAEAAAYLEVPLEMWNLTKLSAAIE